eukprot:scaffold83602_cov48-Phaeocystis_antarctica.AAC.2
MEGMRCGARYTSRQAGEAADIGQPRRTQRVQGSARLQIGGRARGGAHVEHGKHGCDARGVEAQRLVERRRVLPRVERRAYGAGRGAGLEAGGGGRSRCKQGAGRDRLQIGGRARGRAHPEHGVHVCDAGGVEAQRLVERLRLLPSVARRAYDAGRGIRTGRRKAAGDRGARSVQGRARLQIGSRARGGAHGEH